MKLSDHDANQLLDRLKYINDRLRSEGFRGKAKDDELLNEFESYLKNTQSGLKENVCFYCCGTGYKNMGSEK